MTDRPLDQPEPEVADASGGVLARTKWRLLRTAACDPALAAIDVRVLVAAVDHVHHRPGRDFGMLWPSYETLAVAAATNRKSIYCSLKKLTGRAYLVPVHVGGGRGANGGGKSNVYSLGAGPSSVVISDTLNGVSTDNVVISDTLNGVKSVHPTVSDLTHNQSESTNLNNSNFDVQDRGTEIAHQRSAPGTVVTLRRTKKAPSGEPTVLPMPAKRQPKPKTNNIGVLESFQPSADHLARLRAKAPTVAHKLTLLAEQFRAEPYWRTSFETGKYSDPAACFDSFVLRAEGYALDRSANMPSRKQDKPRTAMIAGSEEFRRAYDV